MPPIPDELDEDFMHIRIAKELGVPVTELRDIPGHWIGAAMTMMEWESLERERGQKHARRTGKASGPRSSARGS